MVLTEIAKYNNTLIRERTRSELLKAVEDLLSSGDANQHELIPTNIVLEDVGWLYAIIRRYNELLLDRERLMRASGADSTQLPALNEQLVGMRQNIVQSMQAVRQNLELSIRETQT